ncbi:PorP/SprF family type IX secretion system membrane protein [Pontibacter silvestris]|uniref:PorP/SprF family type IX secretion system membrane protein n=1 Tax=Pontibacter silvestris TaxID=2305183 RepID=A0ABW4X0M5_9BACT|nr:PorP/SprF family type IX secretion system membrane protein [Pontibacter silvestris]MCC9135683.1 PorP/SprF family type IX secretion system membrane protein [Pontibacter silvestris]
MKLKIKICYCLFCFWSCSIAVAQDVHFTQQYANRLYLNPAFAGLNHSWSVTAAYRDQWPALNGSFRTNQLAADYRVSGTKSAIGLVLQQDKAGVGGLQKLQASIGYAYQTQINQNWAMSAGLQAGIASLRVNYDNLVFGDQLSDNGQIALASAEANVFEPTSYMSFSTGGLVFTDQFWLGLTVTNLNKPQYGIGQTIALPRRFTLNSGYKLYVSSYQTQGQLFELSFTPSVTYIQQKNFRRIDLGVHTIYTPFTLGLIYKGVPVVNGTNQDQALSVIVGLKLEQFKVGFSHDIGLKGFSNQAGGANEISLVFEQIDFNKLFKSRLGHQTKNNIACPAF